MYCEQECRIVSFLTSDAKYLFYQNKLIHIGNKLIFIWGEEKYISKNSIS